MSRSFDVIFLLTSFGFYWDERWVLSADRWSFNGFTFSFEISKHWSCLAVTMTVPSRHLLSGLIATCNHVTVVWCYFSSYFFWVLLRALSTECWSMIIQWFYLFIRNFKALILPCCNYDSAFTPFAVRFNCDLQPCHACLMLFFFLLLLGFIEMSTEYWVLIILGSI